MNHQTVSFTEQEKEFFKTIEYARVATVTKEVKPHVTPVVAIYDEQTNAIYFVITYESQKYKNLKNNPAVAVLIDTTELERGILIQGTAKIIEVGKDFQDAYKIIDRISYYHRHPFAEGKWPIIKVIPEKKSVWGKIND